MGLSLLRILVELPRHAEHDVVGDDAVPCLGAALGVHLVGSVAELVQQVISSLHQTCN